MNRDIVHLLPHELQNEHRNTEWNSNSWLQLALGILVIVALIVAAWWMVL